MKRIFLLIISMFCLTVFSQNNIEHNIFMQKFENGNNNSYYTNSKGDLIFFDKVYSQENLKLGLLNANDSLVFKKISISNKKYVYYLKKTYQKDSIENSYNLKTIILKRSVVVNGLKKIILKKIPIKKIVFECNEIKNNNVSVLKSFFLTHVIISKDDSKNKYSIKLIDENCSTLFDETYDLNLFFSDEKKFLIVKNKNQLILVYDKYL